MYEELQLKKILAKNIDMDRSVFSDSIIIISLERNFRHELYKHCQIEMIDDNKNGKIF